MTFEPAKSYDNDRVCLTVKGEFQGYDISAYCSPYAAGRTFIDGGKTEIGEVTSPEKYGAPFKVDLVFQNNVYPMEGETESIRKEVGDEL